MLDDASPMENRGIRLQSADRFQLSGEIDGSLLEGVTELVLTAGSVVVGQHKLAGPIGAILAFRIPIDNVSLVPEGEMLQLSARKRDALAALGRLPAQTRLAGAIDRCNDSLVRGWAANLNCPDMPVEVEILLNGEVQGHAVADRSRADLERLDKRLIATGFLFKFLPRLDTAAATPIQVGVRVRGTGVPLAHSPWWVRHAYDVLPVLKAGG